MKRFFVIGLAPTVQGTAVFHDCVGFHLIAHLIFFVIGIIQIIINPPFLII